MLRPSYSELMQILNDDSNLDNKITSRYAIVIAAAKRARQLIDGAVPQAFAETGKAVSVAVMEMYEKLIKIIPYEYPEYGLDTVGTDSDIITAPEKINIESISPKDYDDDTGIISASNRGINRDTINSNDSYASVGFDEDFEVDFEEDIDGDIEEDSDEDIDDDLGNDYVEEPYKDLSDDFEDEEYDDDNPEDDNPDDDFDPENFD